MICQDIIAKKGLESKYAKDCLIRAIRGKAFADAAALIGWSAPPPIFIRGGIGTLILGEESEEFTPAPTLGKMAASFAASLVDRTPASQEETERRLAICASCAHWDEVRARCSACGCFTRSKASLQAQRCPKSFW